MPLPGLKAVRSLATQVPAVNSAADKKRPHAQLQILSYLWRWRREHRLVNPSVQTLADAIGRTPRTVQRALAALSADGMVVRVYNGGRGRQAIYYLGARALEMAGEHPAADVPPLWDLEADRTTVRGEKSYQARLKVFGSLRLGRVAASRKGDRFVTLTAPTHYREDLENHSTGDGAAGGAASVADATPKDVTPPTPPSGGTVADWTAPAGDVPPDDDRAAMALGALEPAPHGPSHVPPSPPKGARKKARQGRGSGGAARCWERFPALWRAAFGLWRHYHRAARRPEPEPDNLRDARAMSGLIAAALFATGQQPEESLRYLAWGFWRAVRDDRLGGGGRALWEIRKYRPEYGYPPFSFEVPPRDPTLGKYVPRARRAPDLPKADAGQSPQQSEQRSAPSTRRKPSLPPSVVPQAAQLREAPPASPRAAGGPSKLERARIALRSAEVRLGCKPTDARALADARALKDEIARLEGSDGSGTDSETS